MNDERNILEDLNTVRPRMLAEAVLQADLRNKGCGLSLTDMRNHLDRLESKGQVVIVGGEDVTRIKITAAGIARLAE